MATTNELIEQGIMAIKSGNKVAARELLFHALQLNKHNEKAWLWLSGAVDSDAERKYCIEKVLELNPQNLAAQRGISNLAHISAFPPTDTTTPVTDEVRVIQKPKKVTKLPFSRRIQKIAVSPNNLFCTGIGDDLSLYSWRISDKKKQWQTEGIFDSEILTYSPNGSVVITSATTSVPLFDSSNGRFVSDFPIGINKTVYSHNGNILLGWSLLDDEVYIIETKRGKKIRTIKMPEDSVGAINLSGNGEYIAVVFHNDSLWVWKTKSGEVVHRITIGSMDVAFHPSSTFFAANNVDGQIVIFNTVDGREVLSTKKFPGVIQGITWSKDGSTLVAWNFQGEVWVYAHPTYEIKANYKGTAGIIKQAIPNTNGEALTILNEDGTVEFWSL